MIEMVSVTIKILNCLVCGHKMIECNYCNTSTHFYDSDTSRDIYNAFLELHSDTAFCRDIISKFQREIIEFLDNERERIFSDSDSEIITQLSIDYASQVAERKMFIKVTLKDLIKGR